MKSKKCKDNLVTIPAGLVGPQGILGEDGAQGPQGIQGIPGEDATFEGMFFGQMNPSGDFALTSFDTSAVASVVSEDTRICDGTIIVVNSAYDDDDAYNPANDNVYGNS